MTTEQVQATAAVVLNAAGPITSADVAAATGVTVGFAQRRLKLARDAGLVDVVGGGVTARWMSPEAGRVARAEIRAAAAARRAAVIKARPITRQPRYRMTSPGPIRVTPTSWAAPSTTIPNSVFAVGNLLRQDETT